MNTPRSPLLFALLAVLAGCGGKTTDSDTTLTDSGGTDAPSDTPTDVPPVSAGWHSYDASITGGNVDWSSGGVPRSGLPTTFASKWTARLDVHANAAGIVDRAVVSAAYQEPVEYRAGASGALAAVGDAYGIYIPASSDSRMSLHLTTLAITGAGISGAGDASYFEGDVGWSGKGTLTLAKLEDTLAPTWSLPTKGAFADLPLPWEFQELRLSEPVLAPKLGPIFRSGLHASVSPIVSKAKWLGDTDATDEAGLLGVSIVTDQWDIAPSWTVDSPSFTDFARNAIAATTLTPKVAQVLTLESSKVLGTNDLSLGHTWGKIDVDAKCHDGTAACWHLGSVKASYCSNVTQAGIALALSGTAKRVAIEVRAIAKPTLEGSGGTPPGNFAYLQYATPGTKPVTEPIALGDGVTTAGVWDSGWKRVEKSFEDSPATASSAGVALSVGGLGGFGSAGSSDCGGPAPPPWDMDLYVRLVEILP